MGGLSNEPIPDPNVSLNPKLGRKDPFQIAVKRLEIDENINLAHFRTRCIAGCETMP